MRVLHVHRSYLPKPGGATRRLSQLLQAARAPNYVQHVLVTREGLAPDVSNDEVIDGVRIYRTRDWRLLPYHVARLMAEHSYDVVHVHSPHTYLISKVACRGVPVVLESHGLKQHRGWKAAATALALRTADHIVVLSNAAAEWLVKEVGIQRDAIKVIYNGVDFGSFATGVTPEAAARNRDRPLTIGYVGSLHEWQGVTILLDAFAELVERRVDARLRITGDGPVRHVLQKRIQNSNLEGLVEMRGYVPPEEVAAELAHLDLFAMLRPRQLECDLTVPLKLSEVGLAGIPLIVSARPALLEALGAAPSEHALIQTDLSPAGIADTIMRATANGGMVQLRKVAEKYQSYIVRNGWSWERSAAELRRLHHTLKRTDSGQP